jgi:hypothetical protein
LLAAFLRRWFGSNPPGAGRPGPGHARVRWLFLRLLALTYLVAFASLFVQVEGLIGSRGILPVAELLDWVQARTGSARFRLLPTLFWLGRSDVVLRLSCAAGVLLSALALLRLLPTLLFFVLWALYLSLVNVSQIFLGYQWDALLLETGFLAVLLAPPGLRPPAGEEPPLAVLWLLRLLLFRLMFSSGMVKLLSGDPSWWNLTALEYHYWTQPLPTWIGYWASRLPASFHRASVVVTFAIEILAPFSIFGPRTLRLVGCGLLVGLQLIIATTGNYAFFNLLTIALCLCLLDDACLPGSAPPAAPAHGRRPWRHWVVAPVALVLALLSALELSLLLRPRVPSPPLRALRRLEAPLSLVSPYGLFAVMTTSRPEIVVEGSLDGRTWRPYEFRWKPGATTRPPRLVAPHQPRLDWQMWFAALGTCEENPWVLRFLSRLLEGSPPVLGLLADNPFPDGPPQFVRTTLYDYRFADAQAHRREGAFWQGRALGPYCPVLSSGEEKGEDAAVVSPNP